LIVALFILIAGGGLTMQLIAGGGSLLPVLQQVSAPDASPTTVLPWKAEQFFLMVGFILFNLVGIGATLAVLFWLLDRGIRRNKAELSSESASEAAERG
jgi:hypothetical protein